MQFGQNRLEIRAVFEKTGFYDYSSGPIFTLTDIEVDKVLKFTFEGLT